MCVEHWWDLTSSAKVRQEAGQRVSRRSKPVLPSPPELAGQTELWGEAVSRAGHRGGECRWGEAMRCVRVPRVVAEPSADSVAGALSFTGLKHKTWRPGCYGGVGSLLRAGLLRVQCSGRSGGT